MNELVRPMARQEGALLADLEAAFLREPALPPLFSDHIHPSDRGYEIIAREFFRAITTPTAGTSAFSEPTAFFREAAEPGAAFGAAPADEARRVGPSPARERRTRER
jgi:hypothetical protein